MNRLALIMPRILLKRLIFDFSDGVFVEVLGNGSLLEVTAIGDLQGEQQQAMWNTHVHYVTGRNQMRPLLVAAVLSEWRLSLVSRV